MHADWPLVTDANTRDRRVQSQTRSDNLSTVKVKVFITSGASKYTRSLSINRVASSTPPPQLPPHLPSVAQQWAPCGILEAIAWNSALAYYRSGNAGSCWRLSFRHIIQPSHRGRIWRQHLKYVAYLSVNVTWRYSQCSSRAPSPLCDIFMASTPHCIIKKKMQIILNEGCCNSYIVHHNTAQRTVEGQYYLWRQQAFEVKRQNN